MAILNQKRILNLIPKISAPVTLHVSQGDVGTEIQFTLVKGDELFVNPGNVSASVHGVREDGANFGAFTCTLSGSTVSFPLHSEMTAVKGSALAEIVIVDNGGNKVGSANFAILVEESVFPLGVTYDNDVSVYESILAYVQTIPAQVEADITAAVAQETQARQLADNAINTALANEANARLSGDSTEANTRASAISNLQSQINQIIAPSGEAPSSAEVQNARITIDNETKATLGEAIRSQVQELRDDFEGIIWDIARKGAPKSYTFTANTDNTYYPLAFSDTPGGLYYLVCTQTEAPGAERACFIAQGKETPESQLITKYATPLADTEAGVKVWKLEIPSGSWRFGRWIKNSTANVTIKNFMLIKHEPFSSYPQALEDEINTFSNEVFFYGRGTYPTIVYNTSTSKYEVTLPSGSLRVVIPNADYSRIYVSGYSYTQGGTTLELAHDQYLIYDTNDGLFKVTSSYYSLSKGICLCLYNSSGTLIGNWEKYHRSAVLTNIARNGAEVLPYGGAIPTFTVNGTTITFFCPTLLVNNPTATPYPQRFYEVVGMSEAVSVPHNSLCIYNYKTNAIEVKTGAEIKGLEDSGYIILFLNNNGFVKGDWKQYQEYNNSWQDLALYFYGRDAYPKFSVDENGTITVTIPLNARTNYIRKNDVVTQKQYVGGTAEYESTGATFVVPHNSSLVFDMSTHEITVVSGNYDYSPTKQLLFFNSMGSVNGAWRAYWLQDELLHRTPEVDVAIPKYYENHISQKANTINLLIAASQNTDSFIFITDIHYASNAMHSPRLAEDICRKTSIKTVFLNGDYINEENTKADALTQISRVIGAYQYANVDTFVSCGNHEYNNPSASDEESHLAKQLSESELKWTLYNRIRNKGTFDANSLAYYFDNPTSKIRYFVGEVDRGTGEVMSSVEWIGKQMENVPDGWGIVIIFHTILYYDRDNEVVIVQNLPSARLLESIINAAKAKTTYTYNNITYDYTNKGFEMICAFCGDYHKDMDYTTTQGVPIIASTTDSFQQSTAQVLSRDRYTTSEQAFDVITINRDTSKINLTRIGAGSDREFSY